MLALFGAGLQTMVLIMTKEFNIKTFNAKIFAKKIQIASKNH